MSIESILAKISFRKRSTTPMLDAVLYWLLWGMIVVVPVFFLSPLRYPLEFPKTVLFTIATLLGASLFFLRALIRREAVFIRTHVDLFIWIFVGIYIVSFIFSKNHYVSAVGISGYFSASIVSTISFVLFFYLLINVIREKRDIIRFGTALVIATGIIIIFNMFKLAGITLLPFDVADNLNFFLVSGSSAASAIFIAVCMLVVFGFMLTLKQVGQRVVAGIIISASVVLLFFLNRPTALYIAMAGLFIFLLVISVRSRKLPIWWVLAPTIALVALAVLTIATPPVSVTERISESVMLDTTTSLSTTWESVKASPLWGSGPQTFLYDFQGHRPESFNNTVAWNLRFMKASNEFLGMAAAVGILGISSMILVIGFYLTRSIKKIFTATKLNSQWIISVALTVSIVALLIAMVFIPFSFILYFIFWLLLALGVRAISLDTTHTKRILLKKPNVTIQFTLYFLCSCIGCILVAYFGVTLIIADAKYVDAQRGVDERRDITSIEDSLVSAISLNPHEYIYHISLAQGYATHAQLAAVSEEDSSVIQQHTQRVIDTLIAATTADPDNSAVYEQKARIYDSIRNLVSNVDELAIEAYTEAVILEPTSPLAHLNLGRAQLFWAQSLIQTVGDEATTQVQQLLDDAVQNFDRAGGLKQDFSAAVFNTALVYELRSDYETAATLFLDVVKQSPNSIDAYWHLALIREHQGEDEEAIMYLNALLAIDSSNSQAQEKLYQLLNPAEVEETEEE